MAAVAENSIGSDDRQFPHRGTPSSPPPSSPSSDPASDFRNGVRDLVNLLSKLNPSAEEFVPSSKFTSPRRRSPPLARSPMEFCPPTPQSLKKINERVLNAQREDSIRRTVYVSDIDTNVTEEQLAALFTSCGQVLDCRVCGDPHSILRFAFIEFADERKGCEGSTESWGTVLGYYPVRVLPSKTAILPVNPTFLPRSEDEREMCARTVYCTNIDKKVTQADVKAFFETCCGEVSRLRLLGDHVHSTRIAFVEFVLAESALIALNCSGMLLGALPVRVSPSKTPVRPRVPRAMMT
ncbi:unnamed protein product [Spirodela intermedia]|uniref:RRM domain-containing protein n=1 Tax=Spirodela intermedia TaxID=51605 RepID=A0A7I8IT20_SPIIN|nr:unnamed protein product [Spirodela intermedia]CAA6661153.1 unnamed protein product [Spirodela intermedia]